jgi:hypothetical protein
MPERARIAGIDFWRGGVLVAILFDHIPGNGLEHLTPRNFGFSDSAEAFVFMSGLSVGVLYLGRAKREGLASVTWSCARRALKLYGAHLAMTAAAIALFGLVSALTGIVELIEPHGRALVFHEPAKAMASILMLSHQIGYFNILPLYIVMMALAPVILALTLEGPRLALAASIGLYVIARLFGFNLPNAPEPGSWFFNPFAWQLVFSLGVVVASLRGDGPPKVQPVFLTASLVIALVGLVIATDGFGFAPGFRIATDAYNDIGKQNLGLTRLVHFGAIAYLASFVSRAPALVESRVGRALRRLGRHSLPVFAAGSLLSAGGQALIAIAERSAPDFAMPIGMVYTLLSLATLFLLAQRLECKISPLPDPDGRRRPFLVWRPSFVR